jgi:hypothetical protein
LNPEEAACAKLGKALGTLPCNMTREVYDELLAVKGSVAGAESIFRGVLMMGWLGRVMDALGLDLEEALVDEVGDMLRPLGWSTGRHAVGAPSDPVQVPAPGPPRRKDGFISRLEFLSCVPSALLYDIRATSGVPSEKHALAEYLESRVGYSFPQLARLTSLPSRKAVAVAIVGNAVGSDVNLPLSLKGSVGAAMALLANDPSLEEDMKRVSRHGSPVVDGIDRGGASYDLVLDVASESGVEVACDAMWVRATCARLERGGFTSRDAGAIALGIALSTSPVRCGIPVVEMAAQRLSPAEIVEVISWLGTVSMLVRLNAYYSVVPVLSD